MSATTWNWTPVQGRRTFTAVPVALIIEGLLGLECYADLHFLSSLAGSDLVVNGLQLSVAPADRDDLYRTLKTLPDVQAVRSRKEIRADIEAAFFRTMNLILGLTVGFAGVIAWNRAERGHDRNVRPAKSDRDPAGIGLFAGFVASIFIRENILLFLIGLAASVPAGYPLADRISRRYDVELFRMPVVMTSETVLPALAIAGVFLLAVQAVVYRQVRQTDLAEGIKIKE